MRKCLLVIVMMSVLPLQEGLKPGGAAAPADARAALSNDETFRITGVPPEDPSVAFDLERSVSPVLTADGDAENGMAERVFSVRGGSERPPDPAYAAPGGGSLRAFAPLAVRLFGDTPGNSDGETVSRAVAWDDAAPGDGSDDPASGDPGIFTGRPNDPSARATDMPAVPELPALVLFALGCAGVLAFIPRARRS